jgi:fibronectin-binding autotransporter adhesin
MKRKTKLLIAALPAGLSLAAITRDATATTYYWDTNGTTAGAAGTGSGGGTAAGIWGGAGDTTDWSTSSAGTATTGTFGLTSDTTDIGDFSAGTDNTIVNSVTLGGNVSAAGLVFSEGNTTTIGGAYTITLGSSSGITVDSNVATVVGVGTTAAGANSSSVVAATTSQTWTNNSSTANLWINQATLSANVTVSLEGSANIYLGNTNNNTGFASTSTSVFDINGATVIADFSSGGYGSGTLELTSGTLADGDGKGLGAGLTLNNSSPVTYKEQKGGNNTFGSLASGTITLSGTTNYSSTLNLTDPNSGAVPSFLGKLTGTATGQSLVLTVATGNSFNVGFDAATVNTGDVASLTLDGQSGNSTYNLSQAATMPGNVTLEAGTFVLAVAPGVTGGNLSSGGAGLGTVHISGGTLEAAAATDTLANNVSIDGSFATGATAAAGNVTITIGGPATLNTTPTVTLTVSPTITTGNTTGNATGNGTLVINDAIGDGGNGYGLTKTGIATLTLTAANTYTGNTTISQGALQLGNGLTGGTLSTSGSIVDNASLIFDNSGSLAQGTNFSSSGITGNGSLSQIGSGNLILNATNTFGGGTTISAGTLTLTANGTLGGAVNVYTGELAGSGNFTGLITTHGGSVVSPGGDGTVGTLTASGGLTVGPSDTLTFDLGTSTASGDDLIATTNLSLSSTDTVAFNFVGGGPAANAEYTLINYSGTLSGAAVSSLSATGNFSGYTPVFSDTAATNGALQVEFEAVPEPTAISVLALGGLGAMLHRRRTSRAAGI